MVASAARPDATPTASHRARETPPGAATGGVS
nr:MAG TPA: hypothetical protein [Caudoviricetes sp.]